MIPRSILLPWACAAPLVLATLPAQVTLVEPGHVLIQHVDSIALLHPSQALLETTMPVADIESICVDPQTGDLFVQLIFPPGSPASQTTHIFRVSTATGLVTPVALNTGFGICERGTDMQLDPATGLLVTQDQNTVMPERVASINPLTGAIGTWSWVTTPPIFQTATFGMDFSRGAGGSVVPSGDIVFTADVGAAGIHSVTFAGLANATHVAGPALPGGGAGDDLVILPNGTWVWIGEASNPITAIAPFPPHTQIPSALNMAGIFAGSSLPFIAGTRAAVCDLTGEIYVSFSGATGGTGIFRINPQLTTATLVLAIGAAGLNMGLHDLEVGPSSFMLGSSVYFTVHDYGTGGEQVWEVSATACCPIPAVTTVVPDANGLNAPASIAPAPAGNLPRLGNAAFAVQVDDPSNACGLGKRSSTFLIVGLGPAAILVPGLGCTAGTAGEVMVTLPAITASGPVAWGGPGVGSTHPLPIPFVSLLCGLQLPVQGVWLDPAPPVPRAVLSWRLDLVLGR